MSRILILTADLPFFPGKNGHDFFNTRYLAERHEVGVCAPLYPGLPEAGIANLRQAASSCHLWPEPVCPAPLLPLFGSGVLANWWSLVGDLPKRALVRLALGVTLQPRETYLQLGILRNLSAYLLEALHRRRWQVVVLIQSNTAPWLDYLPSVLPRVVLFHDIRSDYLARRVRTLGDRLEVHGIFRQESRMCRETSVAIFVSELDERRAQDALGMTVESAVAPIPVDAGYYHPAPPDWRRDGRPIVLFTGHLSHPPNVDAVISFLRDGWPEVRAAMPDALFQVAGLLPSDEVRAACAAAVNVELHPNVPDIRPFFWNARAYVVPMRFGGGVRQKIVEAWCMGLPVVSTTMGAEGTAAVHGVNCLLADRPQALAESLVGILGEQVDTRGMVANARRSALEHHAVAIAGAAFERAVLRAPLIRRGRPYRLLFDLRWMIIGRAGGLEQQSYELVDAISRLDGVNEYRLHCPRRTYAEWRFPRGSCFEPYFSDPAWARAEAIRAGLVNGLCGDLGRPRVLSPEMRTLRRFRQMDFDLVHSTAGYSFPEFRCFPNVLTFADLQHVHHPEFFPAGEADERDRIYRESCASADHVICMSEHTRSDLHSTYGVPLDKMTTVWNIPSRVAWLDLAPGRRKRILAALGVRRPFFFFPAHGWPHKNHARLVDAFAAAAGDLPADLDLVFVGRPFTDGHPAGRRVSELGLQRRVRHLGYRSPIEMRALYREAHALVFPSLFEGFGMPVVEAMIAGCPVACAERTSLPEIAGPAARLFDPTELDDIARALVDVATNTELRTHLVAEGDRRKALFSARRAALETLGVYRRTFEEYYG